jgi:cell division septum initiation protein DivIVA
MTDRRLRRTAALLEVQRARRAAAESALMSARAAEAEAREREAAAMARAAASAESWQHYLSKPGFAPDYARLLSADLVARETDAAAAGSARRTAEALHEARIDDWRQREAQLRSGTSGLADLRRDDHRRREERALAAIADRVTYRWSRP